MKKENGNIGRQGLLVNSMMSGKEVTGMSFWRYLSGIC